MNSSEEYKYKMIQKIRYVSGKLNRSHLLIANYPVGLKARMQQNTMAYGCSLRNKVIMLESNTVSN